MPFWFRAGQFGSAPVSGSSVSLIGSVYKKYNETSLSYDNPFGTIKNHYEENNFHCIAL